MPVLSKREVYYSDDPTAHTSGGLYKKDLVLSKTGRVVSKKMQERGRQMYERNGLRPRSREDMKALRALRGKK